MFARLIKWAGSLGKKTPDVKSGRCGMCGRLLSEESDLLSGDCGGDCWGCIGEIEADAGWEPSVESVRKEIQDGLRDDDGRAKSATPRSAKPVTAERKPEPALSALNAIKQLLRDDWDPIELMPHLPADEYDTYAMQVFSKLSAGASVEEVANYLSDSEMTGTLDIDRDHRVAQKAMMIMSSRELP